MPAFDPQELPLRILSLISTRAATHESDLGTYLGADRSSKGHRTIKEHIDAALSELIRIGLVDASSSDDPTVGGDRDPGRELTISRHCVELLQVLNLNFDVLVESSSPGAMVVKPIFGPLQYQSSRDWTKIFVAMPFRKDLEHIFSSHIKPVARGLRLQAIRGDNWESDHFIVGNIWNGIGGSKLVVADCTGNNANVMYEVGLAHSIGRPVIIITQNPEDVPHDIRHIRYIPYSCDQEGLKCLESSLRAAIRASLSLSPSGQSID